jgi:AbrB family looped-hinge helix DNA binding protein
MLGYSLVNQKGQVTIPSEIRKLLGFVISEKVMVVKNLDSVVIRRVPDVFALRGSVQPFKKPEDFKKMRKKFKNYLASRGK